MRGAAVACGLVLAAAAPCAGQTHLVIVSGLGGDPQYTEAFYQWGAALADAASKLGVPDTNIFFLAENPERDRRIAGAPTREEVARVLSRLEGKVQGQRSALWIVLIGHGSDRGEPRLSLPGPDLSARELGQMLERFSGARVAVINTASASGGFLPVLSRPGRVVVTATRSGFEQNQTLFPKFFSEAFSGTGADLDKDGRISLLEAFVYARESVRRYYEADQRLLTEHAMLDDDGDGAGTDQPSESEGDGVLAARMFLDAGVLPEAMVADAELAALLARKDSLEARIAELRSVRGAMAQGEYEKRLEELLVELALVDRAIRERGGRDR
ncbi:MAG: hypothetical protein KatS3mg081_0582 [Gemmatimonadales bacterium]|nr:MAG: hypothetical protein KatS3mg081_0582 [Gemmatimonadales bacterium]